MRSKISHLTMPISFTLSGNCSELSTEFVDLVTDVANNLVESHSRDSQDWPPLELFQETIVVSMGDREFRASLDLFVEKKMSVLECQELVELIRGTVLSLFRATQYIAFEAASLRGRHQGTEFRAWWTLYSVVDGTVGFCGTLANPQVNSKEL